MLRRHAWALVKVSFGLMVALWVAFAVCWAAGAPPPVPTALGAAGTVLFGIGLAVGVLSVIGLALAAACLCVVQTLRPTQTARTADTAPWGTFHGVDGGDQWQCQREHSDFGQLLVQCGDLDGQPDAAALARLALAWTDLAQADAAARAHIAAAESMDAAVLQLIAVTATGTTDSYELTYTSPDSGDGAWDVAMSGTRPVGHEFGD